jgi:hypothetical protein
MAQYGRWIDIDGNLHYFDTEKGDVVIYYKEKEPEVEYKIYVDPMPTNCYECPMLVDKSWDDLKDYCHLDCNCSIDVYWDSLKGQTRPNNCPLLEREKVENEL